MGSFHFVFHPLSVLIPLFSMLWNVSGVGGESVPNSLWSLEGESFQISPDWAPCLHRAYTPPGAPRSLYLWDLRCLPPITFPPSSWSCLISLIAGLRQQAAWGGVLTLYFLGTLQVPRTPGGPFSQVFLQWPEPTTVCSESHLSQNNTNVKIIVTCTHSQKF